jgi:endogenous inhibitor of DNA gyrase (YacG/DUF329 family)
MSALKCPICRKEVEPDAVVAPFCSSRCRKIDLGQWLSGRYVIAGEKNVDETSVTGSSDE